jgi:hypothetical protein
MLKVLITLTATRERSAVDLSLQTRVFVSRRPQTALAIGPQYSPPSSARIHTRRGANGGLSDERRKSVLRRAHGIHGVYVRATKQVGHLRRTVQPVRESETELARTLARLAENARERRRERERRIEEEQEAGVFRDVACAVYANWARVNARDARDGI